MPAPVPWVAVDRPTPSDFLLSSSLATEAAMKLSGPEAVHPDALRSYAVHYLANWANSHCVREDGSTFTGSFKHFFRKTRCHPVLVDAAQEGLAHLGAEGSIAALKKGTRIVRQLDESHIEMYFTGRGSGWQAITGSVNRSLERVRLPNEDRLDRCARWTRDHEALQLIDGAEHRELLQERRNALSGPTQLPWTPFWEWGL